MAIYFIEETPDAGATTSLLKIGFTDRDPQDRLRELQTANPRKLSILLVMAGDVAKEASLHKCFAHLQTNGEWFRFTPELQTYLALARFVFPRMVEMEDRLEKCRNRLEAVAEEVDRVSELVGGNLCSDDVPRWTGEIYELRDLFKSFVLGRMKVPADWQFEIDDMAELARRRERSTPQGRTRYGRRLDSNAN